MNTIGGNRHSRREMSHNKTVTSVSENYTVQETEFIKSCQAFVNDYAESFLKDSDDQVIAAVKMKLEHTGYVQLYSKELAVALGLTGHDVFLSELLGLLHDVGRFRQFQVYKTFVDAQSEDHALLGLKVISETGLLDALSDNDRELVCFAIANHNKRAIMPTDDRTLLFSKLIRDADKLDIFRVLSPYLEPSDGMGVNAVFLDEFSRGVQCDYSKIQTLDDRKIVRLIWVYDINFAWTMKRVVERGYIDRIIECLLPNDSLLPGIRRLRDHVEKKCHEKDFTQL
ncbi:MAG: HD domain-containing protein [Selenomonadaceae bacterium]|nr:HD domain-containing protein [Selenomonadaceae bacterium]